MIHRFARLLAPLALLALGGAHPTSASDLPDGLHTDVGGSIASDTTWSLAGSPYVFTEAVVVESGATLRIEAGVEVRIGPRQNLTVRGRLEALGSAGSPIRFGPDSSSWGTLSLEAGSGPSRIEHASFAGGGAGRAPMLRIGTGQALVLGGDFGPGEGYAIEVTGGAPTIRDSLLKNATQISVQPPAAMQIRAGADPVVLNNHFTQNNPYPVFQQADAGARYSGNRFDYNGHNGVMLYGEVSRDVRIYSLGSRSTFYRIDGSGLTVRPGGKLTLEPGATLRFQSGTGIRVDGTLAIRGTASRKVQLAPNSDTPRPGLWRDIHFTAASTPYDPTTGEGSIIDHAEILSGGSTNGAVAVENSSPRIANSLIRNAGRRGIHISGPDARPQIVGNLIVDNLDENFGAGVLVTGGAQPEMRFNILRNNLEGIRSENGSMPRVGPHNWFDFNQVYGMINSDRQVCVDATGNDWGDPNGPNDGSDLDGACGLGANPSGGEIISDNIQYTPYEGQLPRPQITAPRCGVLTDPLSVIEGLAAPGSRVKIYDNQELLGEVTADPGGGGDVAPFRFRPGSPLATGSHVIQVRSERSEEASGITNPLEFTIDPAEIVDPSQMQIRYSLEGTDYVQPYQDASGCLGLKGDGGWDIRPHPPKAGQTTQLTFSVPLSCPSGDAPDAGLIYQGRSIPLNDAGPAHEAEFAMGEGGALELTVACGADLRRSWLLGAITPEYEGFVYDAEATGGDPRLFRIQGARVTLFARDPASPVGQQWKQWGAQSFGGQTNPQTTGMTGWYGWYPPPGEYRVQVEAEGYQSYFSEPVEIGTQPFMLTIGLMREQGARLHMPWLGKSALR